MLMLRTTSWPRHDGGIWVFVLLVGVWLWELQSRMLTVSSTVYSTKQLKWKLEKYGSHSHSVQWSVWASWRNLFSWDVLVLWSCAVINTRHLMTCQVAQLTVVTGFQVCCRCLWKNLCHQVQSTLHFVRLLCRRRDLEQPFCRYLWH